jgi:hypothetical protein
MFRSVCAAGSPLVQAGILVSKWIMAIALIASAHAAGATKPGGVVTILQGRATVIRALSQFDAAEGMRLLADDLVRTDKDTFLRIEYEDQTAIELGPQTQIQVNYPAARKKSNRPALYVLEGWFKLATGKPDAGGKSAFSSIGMDVVDVTGVMVLRGDSDARELFSEQGTARWVDRDPHGAEPVVLKQGEFLVAALDRLPQTEPRPSADFTASLPRAFRDTLPFRYNLFRDRSVAPKGQVPFTYADVEPWLNAEPSIRRQFVVTWRRKADNAAFRASLDRDLQKHPEWDPVLHPEKYEPPPSSPPGSAPPSPPAAAQPPQAATTTPAPQGH